MGTRSLMVPATPIGVPDSNTIVCRAPQRTASGQFGPQSCGRNYEWWNLAMSGKDLAADGKTQVDRPTVANPTGEGDPDAVTCRTSKLDMRGPVCQTNRFWAAGVKKQQSADGGGAVGRARPGAADYGVPYVPGYGGSAGLDPGYASAGSRR